MRASLSSSSKLGSRGVSEMSRTSTSSGFPLHLQTGGGTGQGTSRRRRMWGRRSLDRMRTSWTSWGRPGQTRRIQRRKSRLVGECSTVPLCPVLLRDPRLRCSRASQEDLRVGAAQRCIGGSHSGAWRQRRRAGDVQGTISLSLQSLP